MKNYLVFVITFLGLLGGCKKSNTSTTTGPETKAYLKTTVPYKALPGVASDLLSIDIYHFGPISQNKPVVIYVHGGGWRIGDKTNKLENKLNLFNSLGYIFISVNYRLSPAPAELNNPNRIRFPAHNDDVADAVKWIHTNISTYDGDAAKMVLMGHSAGAHLVSLTGTSQQFLPVRGLPLTTLKGIASFDTEGYDVPSQSGEELYQNAFGTDNAILVQASPIHNLTISNSYPKFFVAKRGTVDRINLANAFINKLQSVGVTVTQVTGSQYDHEGINDAIGAAGETAVTDPLKTFLAQCFQ